MRISNNERLQDPLLAGTTGAKELSPGMFPVDAFEWRVDTDPVVILKEGWDFELNEDLSIVGDLSVTGALNVYGTGEHFVQLSLDDSAGEAVLLGYDGSGYRTIIKADLYPGDATAGDRYLLGGTSNEDYIFLDADLDTYGAFRVGINSRERLRVWTGGVDDDTRLLVRSKDGTGATDIFLDVSAYTAYYRVYNQSDLAWRTCFEAIWDGTNEGDVYLRGVGSKTSYLFYDESAETWTTRIDGQNELVIGTSYLYLGGKAGGSNRAVNVYLATDAIIQWSEASSSIELNLPMGGKLIAPDVTVANLGAGDVYADASGVLYISSDETLKENVRPFERGLEDVLKLDPIVWDWKEESGIKGKNQAGFGAQSTLHVIPEAVSIQHESWRFGMDHKPIIGAVVNAIKELEERLGKVEERAS